MNIAEVLYGWRHYNEMSMTQAAKRVGVTMNVYRSLEGGKQVNGVYLAKLLTWMMAEQISPTPKSQK